MSHVRRSVRCPRCGRIMPLVDIGGETSAWRCPQCKYEDTPAKWTSNVFGCVRTVPGTWRAMMAWRRSLPCKPGPRRPAKIVPLPHGTTVSRIQHKAWHVVGVDGQPLGEYSKRREAKAAAGSVGRVQGYIPGIGWIPETQIPE